MFANSLLKAVAVFAALVLGLTVTRSARQRAAMAAPSMHALGFHRVAIGKGPATSDDPVENARCDKFVETFQGKSLLRAHLSDTGARYNHSTLGYAMNGVACAKPLTGSYLASVSGVANLAWPSKDYTMTMDSVYHNEMAHNTTILGCGRIGLSVNSQGATSVFVGRNFPGPKLVNGMRVHFVLVQSGDRIAVYVNGVKYANARQARHRTPINYGCFPQAFDLATGRKEGFFIHRVEVCRNM